MCPIIITTKINVIVISTIKINDMFSSIYCLVLSFNIYSNITNNLYSFFYLKLIKIQMTISRENSKK